MMSRLFQIKLEFTLILSLLFFLSFAAFTVVYAQNAGNSSKVDEIYELLNRLESSEHNIPGESLNLSKNFLRDMNNERYKGTDTEILNGLTRAHIDYLNTLLIENTNKTKLHNIKKTISEQQQLYDKLSTYNTEISEDLDKY